MKPNKRLELQNKFDLAKKQSEGGDLNAGYCIDRRVYNAYYTNDEWDKFVKSMPKKIANFFNDGPGGEMKERKSRCGNYVPPKMASYGSSSRFLYELAKDIPNFNFEVSLSTVIRGKAPYLDGYLEIEKSNIYVEAKCREIYGNEGKVEVINSYDDFYNYLCGETPLQYERSNDKVQFKWGDREIKHFDLKQRLCHLLGIANHYLHKGIAPVNFIYLVYKPTEALLTRLTEDKDKILTTWNQVKEEAENIDFNKLYLATALYLHNFKKLHNKKEASDITEEQIKEMREPFSFTFCTQNDFIDSINRLKQ